MDFVTVNSIIGRWYTIKNAGARVYNITTLLVEDQVVNPLVDGTDYEVNKWTGMIRFKAIRKSLYIPDYIENVHSLTIGEITNTVNVIVEFNENAFKIGKKTMDDDSWRMPKRTPRMFTGGYPRL